MEPIRKTLMIILLCAVVGMSVFAALTSVVNKNSLVCKATNAQTVTLAKLLSFFEARALANPALTSEEKMQTVSFYQGALNQLPPEHSCP